jgi:hypothetical protein
MYHLVSGQNVIKQYTYSLLLLKVQGRTEYLDYTSGDNATNLIAAGCDDASLYAQKHIITKKIRTMTGSLTAKDKKSSWYQEKETSISLVLSRRPL